ncbi:peptide chain release factor N(5)-glutamine methyltransferase [Salegentibacter mishustinae]|uniref:Release factor glutamine methyltransferase n=1 Tax=Salegentibacter mishustinae TaxID=270918 RepID=A0A0Q9Z7H4_9FLAO|nr:peptide chain release factor N(5)-glutamine methyltransferase [Salegentibacter mishustinae]KRG28907.1 protein-(glutamine-N5) methyltransferase, release factor-specific [Salegentibacter mishustinae]PNW22043.1 protein-(glutamine-N5) methyltransferase, release factor-specific [Salegentibacter mishustinae]PZX65402.1 release factor glutamine methyltransferase [Salegentibacter mishustinae]GGW85288.1 release factor glutamine methyltransferase [Salegentibacter mishustinae]
MKLKAQKEIFFNELESEYRAEEVFSFFFLLTEAFFGIKRLDLALNPETEIDENQIQKLDAALVRLKDHEPIQYIIGETEFFGLTFKVDKNVLVPRPETEELVQWILDDFASEKKALKILDIGTGSGCIAISLAKNLPKAQISAIDISEKALQIAKINAETNNAETNNAEINFIQEDILKTDAFIGSWDIIVSNPPYVRELEKKEMHRNVLEYEPETALYVKDEDPLLFYNKITRLAKESLNPGGKLYFEINQYLADETEKMMQEQGFVTEKRKDIFGNYRMLKGIAHNI